MQDWTRITSSFPPYQLQCLPGDADVDLLPGHGVADGAGKDPGLVSGEVLRVPSLVQVPRHDVGLDAGHVDLAGVALAVHGKRGWEVAVAALVVALIF